MERCPNFYVDISARISELGRQPYASRRFFLEHADRIMFGTDSGPNLDSYQTYYRFLETDDTRKKFFSVFDFANEVGAHLFLHGPALPVEGLATDVLRRREQFAEGTGL